MTDTNTMIPSSYEDPRVKPVAKEVSALTERVESFQVTDADSYENGAEVLRTIKSLHKKAEDQRKSITKPLDEAKRQVMDLFRPFTDALTGAERTLKKRMVAWKSEQDRIAREEARKAEEKARKERERLEAQARKAEEAGRAERAETLRDRAEVVTAAPPPPTAPKVSGIAERKVWKFEVTDPSKVPDEYKTVDERKIGGVVRALKGDTNIPGVRVWEESSLAARSA